MQMVLFFSDLGKVIKNDGKRGKFTSFLAAAGSLLAMGVYSETIGPKKGAGNRQNGKSVKSMGPANCV